MKVNTFFNFALREREKKKAEEARLKEEWEKREKRRKEEEIRDIQAKHTQDKINQLKNTEFGKKVTQDFVSSFLLFY